MLIKALTMVVRVFSLNLPIGVLYNVFISDGRHVIEYKTDEDTQTEFLDNIKQFQVYPDRIAVDFPDGTLWITPKGMEW